MIKRIGFNLQGTTRAGCGIALLVFAVAAIARTAQANDLNTAATNVPATAPGVPAQTTSAPPISGKTSASAPKISYIGGQLTISVLDSTLADVLAQVAVLTGVKLDIPAAASSERMPVVELGPGPARQIVASLLSESTFDYVIQSSATDPQKMQSVLLMIREKKGGTANTMEAAALGSRSGYARAAASPVAGEETALPDTTLPAQPANPAADASSANPQQADPSTNVPSAQPGQSNLTRPGALTPPATLSPQSMNQQLQQMYQQRMQMVQQDRQMPQPAAPAGHGND